MDTPIACTLTTDGLSTQRERWHALAARAFIARVETPDGLQLSFRDLPGVADELRALAEIETGCCAWAVWELAGTTLNVRSTGDGIATLHGMFTTL
jgi:hypothetical protein